ncbi:uncharacterized protein sstn [Venturia canescens]|uniref:uncharacterized protein sstn n=1 Tax=Venturia canescens TaxID=32260 RepID=UPI001C9BC838|nr:uncharacterized protein LOC122413296 [Venturia canescens]
MVMAGTAPSPATDVSLSARLQWLQQRREQLQEKLALKNSELKNLCLSEAELTGVLPPEIPLEPGESPPAFRKRVGTCLTYPQNLINRLKTNEAEESALELERQVQVDIAETSLRKLNDLSESKTVRRKHRSIYQQSQRRLRELDARLSFIRQAYGRIQRQSSTTPLESSSYSCVDGAQLNAKHRTKKPRPPLDSPGYDPNGAKTLSPRNILQESGVSLSPLGIETQLQNQTYRQNAWSPRSYRTGLVDDDSPTLNLASDIRNFNHTLVGSNLDPLIDRTRRRNVKYPENDLNDNHDVYILPERYRQRTYSQGNNGPINPVGPKYCQDTERTYRTIPNTYTEEERQMRYRQMQQKRHLDAQNSRQNIPEQQHTVLLHQKPPLHQSYSSNYQHQPYLDNQPAYYQSDEYVNRLQNRYATMPDEQRASQRKNSSQSQTRARDRRETAATPLNRLSKTSLQESTRSEGQLAAGYWIRENDEIVWCPEEPRSTSNDRFGSLDRRKYSAQCSAPYNLLLQTKDRGGSQEDRENYGSQHNHNITGTRDYVLGLAGPSKFSSASAVTSRHPNYNSQVHQQQIGPSTTSCYETISPSPPPPPRALLRTQSLGSVETWQQQQQSIMGSNPDGLHPRDILQTSSRDDTMTRSRVKEKEWYETSMDSSYSASGTIPAAYEYVTDPSHREIGQSRKIIQPPSPHHVKPIIGSTPPPIPPPLPSPPLPLSNSRDMVIGPLEPRPQRLYPQQPQQQQQPQRHPVSPKSLEIPAESKRRNVHAVVDEQMINTSNTSDRSPDICTIVQAGKYQPYREVTKPFEMSDFYKYSTKYRKRNETATTNNQTSVPPSNVEPDDDDDVASRRRNETVIRDEDTTNLLLNPVQRRIYEPVQRMTCQPYGNLTRRQPMENNEDNEWRGTTINRSSAEDSTVV